MRWRGRAAVLTASLAMLTACSHAPGAGQPPEPGDRAVARINGSPVWTSEVKREAVGEGLIGPGEPLDSGSAQFRQVLEEVIDQKLLAAEAVRQGLDKDPAIERLLSAARQRVLGDALLERSVGKSVNDAAVNGLYQDMVNNETPSEALRLRRIVSASEAESEQVRGLLAHGSPFEAVAVERSRDEATRFKGGELPPSTLDMLPPEYTAALRSAKSGDIVGPFKAQEGWVVVRVDDRRREEPITLDIARPQIIRFLTYDQVRELLIRLRRGVKVETLLRPANGDTQTEPASAPVNPKENTH